jgi:hypothetical protein
MATQAKRSRVLRTASTQALIAGIQKHLSSTSLTIDNTVYATANIVTMLQGQVTSDNAVIAAEAAFHDAVKQDQNPVLAAFMVKLVQAIRIMYASAPAVLAESGDSGPGICQGPSHPEGPEHDGIGREEGREGHGHLGDGDPERLFGLTCYARGGAGELGAPAPRHQREPWDVGVGRHGTLKSAPRRSSPDLK